MRIVLKENFGIEKFNMTPLQFSPMTRRLHVFHGGQAEEKVKGLIQNVTPGSDIGQCHILWKKVNP